MNVFIRTRSSFISCLGFDQECGHEVADRADSWIVGKTDLNSCVILFRVESNDAGMLNQTALFSFPGEQFVRNHLRRDSIPFKLRAKRTIDYPVGPAIA